MNNYEAFQANVKRTAPQTANMFDGLILAALGIGGEGGEVVDLVKKMVYHGHTISPGKLVLELGDVLWYVEFACQQLGMTLEDVAAANIRKLEERYPNGFSVADSLARRDVVTEGK